MTKSFTTFVFSILLLTISFCPVAIGQNKGAKNGRDALDRELREVLQANEFTGYVEDTLEARLGRPIDNQVADLGRNLFFDKILALKGDNSCAGCHAPSRGFGDTQPIAIGIDNNNIVGRKRTGPRNQRRTPMVLNTAFFPNLMLNSRFFAVSDDPFDNSLGFVFTPPEGLSLSYLPHLLDAQAFIPPTERIEMAGFDFEGNNNDIRGEVIRRLNQSAAYVNRFEAVFGDLGETGVTYEMLAAALSEFQISLTLANAPIDQFARGDSRAMSDDEKRGALLFFGKAKCVSCHAVSGRSNEMFSDFNTHVIGVPQVFPLNTNAAFDGPAANEDFGLEQVTGDSADRYKFRTSPLRNVAIQSQFFHNGAFDNLESAIRHHLDVRKSVQNYRPKKYVPKDFAAYLAPMTPVLERLDPLVARPIQLSDKEFDQLVKFVRFGLLDDRVSALEDLIPEELVSGLEPLEFKN